MASAKTILVVEDDAIAREGLNVVLRRAGYEVVLAADGEEALASIRRQHPSLVLLDMFMPTVDGWHFLKLLWAETSPSAVPVLVVTAAPLTQEWAEDHGCAGCVRKPIDPAKMLEEVRRCLTGATGP